MWRVAGLEFRKGSFAEKVPVHRKGPAESKNEVRRAGSDGDGSGAESLNEHQDPEPDPETCAG